MNSEDPAPAFTNTGADEVIDEATGADAPVAVESESPDSQVGLRARMIARFEQWLDQTLAGEPPPRGVPDYLLNDAAAIAQGDESAAETDLYTLFSALTALTGEIRLQGRAFKQLTDLLAPLAETPEALARLAEAIDADQSDAPAIASDEVYALMIDLFDRLRRGLQTCDAGIQSLHARASGGWLRRLWKNPPAAEPAIASVQAIRDAGALTLARLQAAMQQWGMQRIGETGESFDPDRMTAVDVRVVAELAPGTVLAVQRSGYAVNGIIKATAQVTVSKTTS